MIIPILILRIRNDESTVRFSHAYSQTCALLGKRSTIFHAVRVQQLKRSLSLCQSALRSPSTEPRNILMRVRRSKLATYTAKDRKCKLRRITLVCMASMVTHLFCYLYAFDSSATVHLTSFFSCFLFFQECASHWRNRAEGKSETHRDVPMLAMIEDRKSTRLNSSHVD